MGPAYGLFSALITMYAVAILAFTGQPERGIATARIVATLVGAAIGLGVQLIDDELRIDGERRRGRGVMGVAHGSSSTAGSS